MSFDQCLGSVGAESKRFSNLLQLHTIGKFLLIHKLSVVFLPFISAILYLFLMVLDQSSYLWVNKQWLLNSMANYACRLWVHPDLTETILNNWLESMNSTLPPFYQGKFWYPKQMTLLPWLSFVSCAEFIKKFKDPLGRKVSPLICLHIRRLFGHFSILTTISS